MAMGRLITCVGICGAWESGSVAQRDIPAGTAARHARAARLGQEVWLGAEAANLSRFLDSLWSLLANGDDAMPLAPVRKRWQHSAATGDLHFVLWYLEQGYFLS